MNSPKHHVKAADGHQSCPPKSTGTEAKTLKEIPMLNMFLKTLQPPCQYEKIMNETSSSSSSGDGSNTEVER